MAFNVSNSDVSLGTGATNIASSASPQQITFTKVTLNNTGATAVTYILYRVPSGGAAGASNIIGQGSVGANATVVATLSAHTLVGGQSLQGESSVASQLTVNASWTQTP